MASRRDPGGVSERPKVLASKASEGKTSEGSNPSTTAMLKPQFREGAGVCSFGQQRVRLKINNPMLKRGFFAVDGAAKAWETVFD